MSNTNSHASLDTTLYKDKIMDKKFTPFSKKNVIYARFEAYSFSLILIVMVWLGKDVSAISILLSLAWAGYKTIQSLYIWMAKNEHLMDKKIEMMKSGLDASTIENELTELENIPIESES